MKVLFFSVFAGGDFLRVWRNEGDALAHVANLRAVGVMGYMEQESLMR